MSDESKKIIDQRLKEAAETELKEKFQVVGEGYELQVVLGAEGDSSVEGTFSGVVQGHSVSGKMSYGMSSPDSNVLSIELEGEANSDELHELIQSLIDEAPDFQPWANWAMANTPQ